MEDKFEIIATCTSAFLVIFLIYRLLQNKKCPHKKLPPGPPAFPIIGHLHLLRNNVPQNLCHLADKYGDVMYIRIGTRKAVVISSPQALEECCTKSDLALSGRPRGFNSEQLLYNYTSVVTASYGPNWRNTRRIVVQEMLTTARVAEMAYIRQAEVNEMVKELFHLCGRRKQAEDDDDGSVKVDLRPRLSNVPFNITMRMMVGKRYSGVRPEEAEKAAEFKQCTQQLLEFMDMSCPMDIFPFLEPFFGKFKKTVITFKAKIDKLMQELVDEARAREDYKKIGDDKKRLTMVDTMLMMQETDPENYSDQTIKGMITAMMVAGTDTSTAMMEWAMTHLLNHPHVLEKLTAEINTKVGRERMVEEGDLPNLPYLQCVLKESSRYMAVAPFLAPRACIEDCTIKGYLIPKGAMVFFSAYAIQRNSEVWPDPLTFKPERFHESTESNSYYKLPSFGGGRRKCPGEVHALKVILLSLATLIQCFEWKRVSEDLIDSDIRSGCVLLMTKANPLVAMCKPRTCMVQHLKKL